MELLSGARRPQTIGRRAINRVGPAPEIYALPKNSSKNMGLSPRTDETVLKFFAGISYAQARCGGGAVEQIHQKNL